MGTDDWSFRRWCLIIVDRVGRRIRYFSEVRRRRIIFEEADDSTQKLQVTGLDASLCIRASAPKVRFGQRRVEDRVHVVVKDTLDVVVAPFIKKTTAAFSQQNGLFVPEGTAQGAHRD